MNFADYGLHPTILETLTSQGYETPTPVQAASIPVALEGRDVLANAETGTGKTAAFVLPTLTRIADGERRSVAASPRVLILAPTRELAQQVMMAARKYGRGLRLNTIGIVGGASYREQFRDLSKPVDILVATPGRLMDHMQRGSLSLASVGTLVLDEADRMLDMGFLDDVEAIAAECPAERQTLLFTATLDRRMAKLAEKLLRDPTRVDITPTATVDQIEQRILQADDLGHKLRLLHKIMGQEDVNKAIVFAATKRDADNIAEDLYQAGFDAAPLHGDMRQRHRDKTLRMLREGRVKFLIATDVAARGIDVPDISHVINFDLPRQAEDYVHRIGRTGRAGASGTAISFAGRADRGMVQRIERYTGHPVTIHTIEGLEPQRPWGKFDDRPQRGGGGRDGGGRGRGGFGSGGGRRPEGGSRFDERRFDGPRAGGNDRFNFHRDADRSNAPREGGFRGEGRGLAEADRPRFEHRGGDRPAFRRDNDGAVRGSTGDRGGRFEGNGQADRRQGQERLSLKPQDRGQSRGGFDGPRGRADRPQEGGKRYGGNARGKPTYFRPDDAGAPRRERKGGRSFDRRERDSA